MSKDPQVVQGIGPGEGARRATESGPEKKSRYTARRKVEVVMRLLRGEDLESLSRGLQIPAAKTPRWRKDCLDGGHLAMMGAKPDDVEAYKRLPAEKIGDLTMETELQREKIRKLEENSPLSRKMSKRRVVQPPLSPVKPISRLK